jgi:hypothetical protein
MLNRDENSKKDTNSKTWHFFRKLLGGQARVHSRRGNPGAQEKRAEGIFSETIWRGED